MNFKKLFLPLGIILAVAASLLLPEPGIWLKSHKAVYVLVMLIFFLNGWSFKAGEIKASRGLLPLMIPAIILSLVLAPLAADSLSAVLGLDTMMDTGLIVMSAMPTTLSSAIVITAVSGGNKAWAMFFTIGLNLAAIIAVPLTLPLFLELENGVSVNGIALLCKMLLLVLLPFACGCLFKLLRRPHEILCSYIPSVCVVLTVYAAFSASSSYLKNFDFSRMPLILLGVFVLHAGLFIGGAIIARISRMNPPEKIPFILCTAQKTLPMAISILTAAGIDDGLVLIPCLLYYFIQLTLDTVVIHHIFPAKPADS